MSKKRKNSAGTPDTSANVVSGLVFAAIVLTLLTIIQPMPVWTATYTVTTIADSGPGSLREALSTATAGDTIEFVIGTPQYRYARLHVFDNHRQQSDHRRRQPDHYRRRRTLSDFQHRTGSYYILVEYYRSFQKKRNIGIALDGQFRI